MIDLDSKAKSIFYEALNRVSADELSAYLDNTCGDDTELRKRVDSLLRAHRDAGNFLGGGSSADGTIEHPAIVERPGTVIGPYKLLQQIGEGGFGVVFEAEQERPIRRRVALKVIKPGMDTREVIARFEAERQALALMDHPNIAKVHDAGMTENGRPYFVMELVQGVPMTEYCDQCNLTTRERLGLFITVCQAVQHAHQKGVIHRDIKPSNVLVAIQDGQPAAKIIDFGVAKAINQQLTQHTLMTAFAHMMGTPPYMSPEQAELSPLGVDTRSDIYSLGVLLYELLTGTTPFDKARLKVASYDELRRIIREEEPPRPSARISTLAADRAATVAEHRRTDVRRLRQAVRGELDWIVMKCLEKDRNRRYESAGSLARDVERYLNDKPVQACPPSVAYRVTKFIRRNRVSVLAGSAVTLALILGLALATVGFVQARREARISIAEAAKATAISELLQAALESANPDLTKGIDYTVRQLLDDISAKLEDQLKGLPEAEASIQTTIGNAYRRIGLFERADSHLKKALDLQILLHGLNHANVSRSRLDYAWNLAESADLANAESQTREALAIHRKLGLRNDVTVEILSALHHFLNEQLQFRDAEKTAREALTIAAELSAPHPEVPNILHRMADAALWNREYVKAEQLANKSVDLHRQLHGNNHLETAWGLIFRGSARKHQGRLAEAETDYLEALAIYRRLYNDVTKINPWLVRNLAEIFATNGNNAGLDELRALLSTGDENNSRETASLGWEQLFCRGSLYAELGDFEKAQGDLAKSSQLAPERLPARRSSVLYQLALVRLVLHDHVGYRDACEKLCALTKPNFDVTCAYQAAWACCQSSECGIDWKQIVKLAERAVEAFPHRPEYLMALGAARYRDKQFEKARTPLVESISAFHVNSDDIGVNSDELNRLIYSKLFLAMVEKRSGKHADAQKLLAEAQVAMSTSRKTVTGWTSRAAPELLYSEAEALIGQDPADATGLTRRQADR